MVSIGWQMRRSLQPCSKSEAVNVWVHVLC